MDERERSGPTLKRELGTFQAYALLIGILVGAGIFRVTSDATAATGPSVILAHLVLAPVVLATSVAYLVFLSTSLGLQPGGEILHIARTFRSARLTFLAGWLKSVAYLGAAAYLADALALNLLELVDAGGDHGRVATKVLALGMLGAFVAVHLAGVRWFGRVQVAMCMVLAVSLAVLIVPGLFAVETANYRPFFTNGASGFASALPPLFFAYAAFEALAHAGAEVRDSRSRLPRVFLRGILATTTIFIAMSLVAFGVLPASEVGATGVPMSRAAATYLPLGAELLVTLGAVMAVATSLNATIYVPARLGWSMAQEGFVPRAFGRLHATRGTPVAGLLASSAIVAALLVLGQTSVALGISVVGLMLLYAVHSLALILVRRRNPALFAESQSRIPRGFQIAAAWASVVALLLLVALRFGEDVRILSGSPFASRVKAMDLTSLELMVAWVVLGLVVFQRSSRARMQG